MPRNDLSKRPDHKELSAKGGRNSGAGQRKAAAKRREMRERWMVMRDMPLTDDHPLREEGCETYGDAWAWSMSEKVIKGENGSVEALKLILAQIGEDTAEKQEIKVVYNNKEASDLMG